MFVERYVAWAQDAPVVDRCEAVRLLVQALTDMRAPESRRVEAARMLVRCTDDPSIEVRSAMAEALCQTRDLPRTLLWQVCRDVPAVAAIAYERSPDLSDAELIDAVDGREPAIQTAIAGRADLSAAVVRAIAHTGCRDGVLVLLRNEAISPGPGLLLSIARRFADDATMRGALLDRPDCPPQARACLGAAVASDLQMFACAFPGVDANRIASVASDAVASLDVALGDSSEGAERQSLVRMLRDEGRITPAMLLRAVGEGAFDVLAEALAAVTGCSAARARSQLHRPARRTIEGFANRCGLSPAVGHVLFSGLRVHAEGGDKPRMLRTMLDVATQHECDARLVALLARLEGEATRRDAFATAA